MSVEGAVGEVSMAVVGAGAVGLYYGSRLAAAGEDVTFLMRSGFQGTKERGEIQVSSVHGDLTLPGPKLARDSREIGPVDLVLITWKTTSNAHYEEVIAPLVGKETTILTMQNGLGNTERLAELFGGEHVMGGLCFVCINQRGPGQISHTGGGAVALGEYERKGMERVTAMAERFRRAGIQCKEETDLARAQWKKLVWNIPFNGLCITEGGIDTRTLLTAPGGEERVRTLMGEVIAGAAALGHTIRENFVDEMIEVTRPMGDYRPSSMIDFVEGREVEVEQIWREPLRRARAAGARLPHWEALLSEIESALRKRSKTGSSDRA